MVLNSHVCGGFNYRFDLAENYVHLGTMFNSLVVHYTVIFLKIVVSVQYLK